MYNFIMWKEDAKENQLEKAAKEETEIFNAIKSGNLSIQENSGIKLTYRQGQRDLAKDVMTAIRDNQILLVQAGVGIGKSIGYLIPVFTTFKNVKDFNSIIISTSNIALQQQLLTTIDFVSKLLNVKIKASIAKGINNYACLKRLDDLINTYETKDKEALLSLRKNIEKNNTIDRDELKAVSDEVWKQVQIQSRGECSRCIYSKHCLYRNISKNVSKADIVITNHGNFVRSIMDDRDYVNDANMYIIDEAHKLEDSILSITQDSLNLELILRDINYYINNSILKDETSLQNAYSLTSDIKQLFSDARYKSRTYFKYNNQEGRNIKITDCDKIPLRSKTTIGTTLTPITLKLEKMIQDIEKNYDTMRHYRKDDHLSSLKKYLKILKDMEKGRASKNIYWANYYKKDKIQIGYAPKSNKNITQRIFGQGIPVVCTSGTLLDATGSYNYFKNGLSFDKISFSNQSIVDGRSYASPYDYENNSLFYYDTEIANPNNYEKYLQDLVIKIEELIRITNGRSLILFTSKSTMEQVYQQLQKQNFNFKLLMQGTMSNDQISKKFKSDVKSCLFATGAFWEGIDIAGKSLSNVIITRLPFSNVDAITEYKASECCKKDAFRMVYLNEMIQKLAQGTGRLIRSEKDKGIICCLDSRFNKIIDSVQLGTPYTRFTSNIQDVYDFSKKNITNRDKHVKIKRNN